MNDTNDSGLIPVAELNKITSEILSDRRHSNKIVDLIDILINIDEPNTKESYCQSLVQCLTKIFTNYIDRREMVLLEIDDGNQPEQQVKNINSFKSWLIKLYDKIQKIFIEILTNDNDDSHYGLSVRKTVLKSLMRFVEEEGKFPFRSSTIDATSFPIQLLSSIVHGLCSNNVHNQELIKFYSNYYQYDDVIHHTMILLREVIEENRENLQDGCENLVANLFEFIHPIHLITPNDLLPKSFQESVRKSPQKTRMRLCELQKYDQKNDCEAPKPIRLPTKKFKFDYERDAKIYSSLWMKFLSLPLPPSIYKQSLVCLDKHALQHFAEPLYLADFLISSFGKGGIISILSLSPIYTLMHKCNLEFPNFFSQLYQLLEPAITYKQQRARFLFWCDLFLTSTHIPATIVASFAKKLARLSVRSTPDTITIMLKFIANLMIRHPLIQRMLQYKEMDPNKDPFVEDEKDPEKTQAINSYMWELNLLQAHYYPEIAVFSEQIFQELPRFEVPLEDHLETYMEDILEKVAETEKHRKNKLTYDIDCDLYNIL